MTGASFGIAGVEAWGPPVDARSLAVDVELSPAPAQPREIRDRIDAEWNRACAANPRMFDGPLLAVTAFDAGAGRITCRPDSFRHIIARPAVDTGVELLAVSAVILAEDAAGVTRVFLGRRGEETRIYGGMWELGPSGGITPPSPGIRSFGIEFVLAQLEEEMREEAGLSLAGAEISVGGFVRDFTAFSLDILITVRAKEKVESLDRRLVRDGWEYGAAAWVPLDDIAAFDRSHGTSIIAPTRAAFRLYGWNERPNTAQSS